LSGVGLVLVRDGQSVNTASQDYLRFAQVQYKIGLVDYLTVIDAERTLLTNQLTLAENVNLHLGASIRLINALGGGWEDPPIRSSRAHVCASMCMCPVNRPSFPFLFPP